MKKHSTINLPEAKKEIKSIHSEKMVDYLSRSLILEERGAPNFAKWSILAVFLLVICFGFWAHVTPVREMAFASGEILPENFVQPVQHLEGGIVKSINVASGDWVEKGQAIIVLDEIAFQADWEQLKVRQASLKYQAERLRAFANDTETNFGEPIEKYNHILNKQVSVYNAQLRAKKAQLTILDNQIEEMQTSLEGMKRRKILFHEQQTLLLEEVNILEELYEKKLTRKSLLLQKKQQAKKLQGEWEQLQSQMVATQTKIEETKFKKTEFIATLKRDSFNELSAVVTQLSEVDEQLKRLDNRVDRLIIKAPISGTVKDLRFKAIGAVLAPGDTIAEIVPESPKIFAEIEISPRDIGHVHAGMQVFIKVDTYEFSRYGGVPGILETISATNFTKDNGQIFFKGRVKLDADRLQQNDKLIISPGMTVVADIQTGEKTIMAYLVRPIHSALKNSFHER